MLKKTTVVIVGRPNVGKSTLFNRLVGRRVAIVHNLPGVTRDRKMVDINFYGKNYTLIDTPGLYDPNVESADKDILLGMREQALKALNSADIICFMIDGRQGCTPYDYSLASELRKLNKNIIILVNKSEGNQGLQGLSDAHTLNMADRVVPISAEHGEGLSDLADAFLEYIPNNREKNDHIDTDKHIENPISLTIIGRPNAGKSTLFNQLIGEERQLTGSTPGLTRDAIESTFSYNNHTFKIIDTAGIRKRSKVFNAVEKLSVLNAQKSLQFTEIAILLLDAGIPFENHLEKQDLLLAQKILDEGRTLVIALNKWDVAKDKTKYLDHIKNELSYKLSQAAELPIITLSAETGSNKTKLLDQCLKAYKEWNKRVPTGELNTWFEHTINEHLPPIVNGIRIKLKYITQIKTRPPTFAIFGTKNVDIPDHYKRYLTNRLKADFSFHNAPVRIHFRSPKNPYKSKKGA